MSEFTGFPATAFTFYQGLENDNSKSYWEAHRGVWETDVQEPMQSLVTDLETEFPPLRIFRPQRDVRFSKDRTPYKTWAGLTSEPRAVGGVGFYLRLEASGLRVACGAMVMAADQIERFRVAIDHRTFGPEFVELTEKLAADSLPVTCGKMPPLKRPPSGYPSDHPREEFLRWKGAVIIRDFGRAGWMSSAEALDRVREVWSGAAPLTDWLVTHVGPSEVPARAPRARR